MRMIKEAKRTACFQELSKKEKQTTLGGGLMNPTSFLREVISYFAPRTND